MGPKLITTLPDNVEKLLTETRDILTAMTDNPHFRNISPEFAECLAKGQEKIDLLQTAYNEAKGHDTKKVAYRKQLQRQLIVHFGKIAKFAELVADGDITKLKSTGFKLARDRNSPIQYPLTIPVVTLRHGPSGTIVAQAKPLEGAWGYKSQIADGDPTVAENWRHYGDHPHCTRIEITGRTPGKYCSVRLQGIWVQGEGPWSVPVTLMSL